MQDERLEALYRIKGRLETKHYVHRNWNRCTCGHIYTGSATPVERLAQGVWRKRRVIQPERVGGLYLRVMRVVAEANGIPRDRLLAHALSDLTRDVASNGWRTRREAAILLVENAIRQIEREHEQARLDVIAAAERVVAEAGPDVAGREPREVVGAR